MDGTENGHEIEKTQPHRAGTRGSYGLTPQTERRIDSQAVLERWPIPPELRGPLVERQAAIAMQGAYRESTAATRCIVAMDAQNQAAQFTSLASGTSVDLLTDAQLLAIAAGGEENESE